MATWPSFSAYQNPYQQLTPSWATPGASNWANETTTMAGPTGEQEAGAYGTAYGPMMANASFGQVSPGTMSNYYDLAGQQAFGQGNERINQILAERGFGPNRVGMGAEMAGRLATQIALARASGMLGNEQMGVQSRAQRDMGVGQSRYGALTRGTTQTTQRSGYQAPPGANQPGAFVYPQATQAMTAASGSAGTARQPAPTYAGGAAPASASPYPSGSSYGMVSGTVGPDSSDAWQAQRAGERQDYSWQPGGPMAGEQTPGPAEPTAPQSAYANLPTTAEDWWKTSRGQQFAEKGWTPSDWSFLNMR